MDCVPELVVMKRKTVSSAKMAKRLRRFVRDNQPPDVPAEPEEGEDLDDENNRSTRPAAELLCRIPEETLFQLQQIYEALEDSTGGGVGGEGISGGNRRKSAPGPSSLRSLIASSAPRADEEQEGRSESHGGVRTPAKSSKQKRARGGDQDVQPEPATDSKATSRTAVDAASPKRKKKKGRRKSNAT
ncbi:unnamed protein product [Scytosiphon promiscuus]